MNADEVGALTRRVLASVLAGVAGNRLATVGIDPGSVVTLGGCLATILWGVYAHWNMKKVPESARVTPLI